MQYYSVSNATKHQTIQGNSTIHSGSSGKPGYYGEVSMPIILLDMSWNNICFADIYTMQLTEMMPYRVYVFI